MIFGIVAGVLVVLVGAGIAADAIARRRRGIRAWSDTTAGNQYSANQDAKRAKLAERAKLTSPGN